VKRGVSGLVNWALVASTVVVALVAIEVGLRYAYPQPLGVWHQDRDGLALHWPGLVAYLPQFGHSVSFNSAGMRDREHPAEKAEDSLRILVLGDSFMEALQVPFDASFPSLLERELAATAGRRVDVINASVSGWGTDDALKYLTSYGLRLKPDLIIVAMTLYNDVSDNLRERFHSTRDGTLVSRAPTRASFLGYKITELKGLLATRSHAYQLLIRARRAGETQTEARQLRAHFVDLFRDPHDPRTAKGIELTMLLLDRIRTVAASRGAQVVLVMIPLAVQLSAEEFAEFARVEAGSTDGLDIDRPQRVIGQAARRIGIATIDLLPGFRDWTSGGGSRLYLTLDGHWNAHGHRLGATVAAAELARLGLARAR
jgi:hypothetical protein